MNKTMYEVNWHEVSKDEFFRRIGDMDVTPNDHAQWQ